MSAIGNITAALAGLVLAFLSQAGVVKESWRIMFVIGTLPALLALLIMRRLKEPERWRAVAVSDELKEQLGALRELFGTPRWRLPSCAARTAATR